MTPKGKAAACEYLAGVVLVFALWFLTWTWPVWLWCAGSFLGAWLIQRWRLRLSHPKPPGSSGGRGFVLALTKDGRDALLAASFGCFVIMVSQFVLRLCDAVVAEQVVRNGEIYLDGARRGLAYVLSVPVLALLLGTSVLLAVIFPQLRLARWSVDRKKLVSKVLIGLTAASSFTFFGALSLEGGQRQWTARRRVEVAATLTRIGEARRQLIAAENVKRTLSSSAAGFRADLRTLLAQSCERPDADIIAEGTAERLSRQAPVLHEGDQARDPDKKESLLDGIIGDVRIWTDGRGSATYQPSFGDLQFLAKTADRLDAGVKEAHAAVGDVIKTAAGGLVSPHADAFVRLFAKSLVGAAARHSVASAFPRSVSDLRTAALWLDLAVAEPQRMGADLSTRPEWRVSLRSPETFLLAPEEAVAIEVRMAKSEGENRRRVEAEAHEAQRLEMKRANEEYRAREVNRRGAESYRAEPYRPAPRAVPY